MPLAFARKLVVMSMFPLPIAFGADSQLHHIYVIYIYTYYIIEGVSRPYIIVYII